MHKLYIRNVKDILILLQQFSFPYFKNHRYSSVFNNYFKSESK